MERLTVSGLAAEVGTSADTLRYYERIGLLGPAPRSPAGYRLYDLEAVEQVRFIKRAQSFGLRLADIADLIAIRQRGLCPCGGTRRLLEARMAELDEEMATLSRLRHEIADMLQGREAGEPAEGSVCGPLCRAGTETGNQSVRITAPAALTPTRPRQPRQRREPS